MDILIPLGTESNWANNELRYALRSIERYATGYERVFVVGDDPGFLSPEVKFFRRPDLVTNKQARIAYKILWAWNCTDISEEIAFWNDDYVLTGPVDVSTLPFYYRCTLAESIQNNPPKAHYRFSLEATQTRLKSLGRPTLDFDGHVPIRYNRDLFRGLAMLWMESASGPVGYTVKSTYCNATMQPPTFYHDCKVRGEGIDVIERCANERWIFSYSDQALFDTGRPLRETEGLKGWLAKTFPDKSRFEV